MITTSNSDGAIMFYCSQVESWGRVVHIGSLPSGTTQRKLRQTFQQFGTITSLKIIKRRSNGVDDDFAFVTFTARHEADTAIESKLRLQHLISLWSGRDLE